MASLKSIDPKYTNWLVFTYYNFIHYPVTTSDETWTILANTYVTPLRPILFVLNNPINNPTINQT